VKKFSSFIFLLAHRDLKTALALKITFSLIGLFSKTKNFTPFFVFQYLLSFQIIFLRIYYYKFNMSESKSTLKKVSKTLAKYMVQSDPSRRLISLWWYRVDSREMAQALKDGLLSHFTKLGLLVLDTILGSFSESNSSNQFFHVLILFRCINKEKGKQVSLHPYKHGNGKGYTFTSYSSIGGFKNEFPNLQNALLALQKPSGKKIFKIIETERPATSSSSFTESSFSEKVTMVGNQESRIHELEKSNKKLKKEISSIKSQVQFLTDEILSLKGN
jgi:hypothetical protein